MLLSITDNGRKVINKILKLGICLAEVNPTPLYAHQSAENREQKNGVNDKILMTTAHPFDRK